MIGKRDRIRESILYYKKRKLSGFGSFLFFLVFLVNLYYTLHIEEYKTKINGETMKIFLTAINAKYIHSNLAVYSLKAYAGEYGEYITIGEYTINNRLDDILKQIYKQKPDVLCFSCYIWNLEYVEELMREYHKLCPKVPIWVGGPEVSYEVETFLKEHPEVTGVEIGEGERTFLQLCRYYVNQMERGSGEEKSRKCIAGGSVGSDDKIPQNLSEIRGIAYRSPEQREKILITAPQEPLDMSQIPFCYDKVEDFTNRIIYYESSRGCPFSCSYCLSSIDKKLRFRDMELVKKDVKTMPPGEIDDILMASAYLPGFKSEKLGGKYYADGGTMDNVPIQVLLDHGYQDIIVIRIYGIGLDRVRWTKIPEETNVWWIAPREELGGMLEFDRKRSRKNMALGYLEACRLLYGLKGRHYYIDAPQGEPYYFDRMMSELELLKLYLKEVLDEETMRCLNGYRFFTEHIFPDLARKWDLPEQWDYKDIYLGLLEELAMRFQLSRYRVYTADELAGAVHRAILQTNGVLPSVTGLESSGECF